MLGGLHRPLPSRCGEGPGERVAGGDADVADRLRAVAGAYRAWSVAHPNQFALLFGDPIPGCEAPTDGPTTATTRPALLHRPRRGAPELALTLLLAWGRLHGQVSLEVFGHHAWLFPDGCGPLFDAEVAAMVRDLGVTG